MMPLKVLRNARIFDFDRDDYRDDLDILIEGEDIREVSERPLSLGSVEAREIDCRGRIVMPGLIDAHVHVIGVVLDLKRLAKIRPYLVAAQSKQILEGMLQRGFTTVRDAGGADSALAEAVSRGYFIGPRLFVSGLALAPPHGQGDFREAGDLHLGCPLCRGQRSLTRLVDGVAECRQAVRAEIADGACQIKVMASGGIASDTPLEQCQFSAEELRVITEEAARRGRYVMAHAYENAAVRRCLEAGVRSIEHGSRLDAETLTMMRKAGAFLVPTLSAYDALRREGPEHGFTAAQAELFAGTLHESLETVERAFHLGVSIGHGSDLEGPLHRFQSREFALKAEVLPAKEVMRAATVTNAALLEREGRLGVVAPGAVADLLLVEGDPYRDISVLSEPEKSLALIMQAGRIVKARM